MIKNKKRSQLNRKHNHILLKIIKINKILQINFILQKILNIIIIIQIIFIIFKLIQELHLLLIKIQNFNQIKMLIIKKLIEINILNSVRHKLFKV